MWTHTTARGARLNSSLRERQRGCIAHLSRLPSSLSSLPSPLSSLLSPVLLISESLIDPTAGVSCAWSSGGPVIQHQPQSRIHPQTHHRRLPRRCLTQERQTSLLVWQQRHRHRHRQKSRDLHRQPSASPPLLLPQRQTSASPPLLLPQRQTWVLGHRLPQPPRQTWVLGHRPPQPPRQTSLWLPADLLQT
jgi:hypothetical protein